MAPSVVRQTSHLCFLVENMKVIKQLNIPQLIIRGLEEHKTEPNLVKNGFLALSAIVEADGKLLNNPSTDRRLQFVKCQERFFECRQLFCFQFFLLSVDLEVWHLHPRSIPR